MKRIVNIAKNHKEAREWDIKQVLAMTPEQRQKIAKRLKLRVFGEDAKDVRSSHRLQLD